MSKKKIIKITTFFIVLFPILNIYGTFIPSISLGELLLALFLFISRVFRCVENNVNLKKYYIYIVYMLFSSIILLLFRDWFNLNVFFHSFFSIILYFLFLFYGVKYFNIDYGIKLLKKVSVLSSIFLIIQFLVFLFFGYKLIGLLPGLPLSSLADADEFYNHQLSSRRFSSFFDEPSHYAQYVGLGLILILFLVKSEYNKLEKKISIIIIITGLLLSKSGNAYILLAVIIAYYYIKRLASKIDFSLFFQLVGLCISLLYLIKTDIFKKILGRANEFSGTDGLFSGYIRVIRGYQLYDGFNLFDKIFGISGTNIKTYMLYNPGNSYLDLTTKLVEYVNAFQFQLIFGGLIGTFFFINFYYDIYRNGEVFVKIAMIVLIILSLMESIYNTPTWILFMIVTITKSFKNKLKNE